MRIGIQALLAIGLTGCVATAAPLPPRRAETPPIPGNANEDPPGKPPSPDAAWVPGHWHWNGTENVWVPGRWEVAPGNALYGP